MLKTTLIVQYLPRGSRSHTRKLVEFFLELIWGKENQNVETLDLVQDVPDLFLEDNLQAYTKRNYLKQKLTPDEEKLLEKMDRMTAQLKRADHVVLACPLYNYSLPAVVKAYFDSVILKGETWKVEEGNYIGLLPGRKALILMASGGTFEGDEIEDELGTKLARLEFEFMGFTQVDSVLYQGVNRLDPKVLAQNFQECQEKIQNVVYQWSRDYSN